MFYAICMTMIPQFECNHCLVIFRTFRTVFSFPWWRHQMEAFSPLLPLCAGNSSVTGESPPHKGQWRGALMFSLICAWTDAGDLWHHRAHCDVSVMLPRACDTTGARCNAAQDNIICSQPCKHCSLETFDQAKADVRPPARMSVS